MDEIFFSYIAIALHVVSLVLIWVDGGIQRLVYYASKSLHEVKVRYLPLEKAILAVVHATRKLPHYFQVHIVIVLTQLPLKALLQNANYTGKVAKWAIILGAFDIKYMPCTSIRGQVLVDLVAELAESPLEVEAEKRGMNGKLVSMISQQGPLSWKVYVNGAAN